MCDIIAGVAYVRWYSPNRSDDPVGFWLIVALRFGALIGIALQFDMSEFSSSNAGIKVASAIISIVWISMVVVVAYYMKNDGQ